MQLIFQEKELRRQWLKKPLFVEDLPTVPELECAKGYIYNNAIELDDVDSDDNEKDESPLDHAICTEMAFDET